MQYPESHDAALIEQLQDERVLSALVEIALTTWLDIAKADVLRADAAPVTEPAVNPAAAADHAAQWDYLVDGLVVYAVAVLAAQAYDAAYFAMTAVPLAAAEAIVKLPLPDMPGMPTREHMYATVRRTFARYTDISVDDVQNLIETVPDIRNFAEQVSAEVKPHILDAVGRVHDRTETVLRDASPTDTPAQVRAEAAPIFDPIDPQWAAAAALVATTQTTGALNAGLERAARTAGGDSELEWVAILDSHTRTAHADASGQLQPPGHAFDVGGEHLRFPADPRGSIENTANCRCRLFAKFRKGVQASARPLPPHAEFVAECTELATNWVDACGGLPTYIKRIAKHLTDGGMEHGHAIATAVNAVHKMCETGDTNFPGRQSVNKMSRAQACTAASEWTKLKECAARKRAQKPHHSITAGGSAVDYRSFTSTLAVIGTPTDDGRIFADNIALAFRDMPLPLLWQKQSAGGHYDAYTVGVITSAGVVGKEVIGKGYMLNTPEATEAAGQIEHGVTGPSVDLGDVTWEMRNAATGQPVTEQDFYDNPDLEVLQTVMSAKVLAATLVATPAFGETSISLGDYITVGDEALTAAAAMAAPGVIDLPTYDASLFANPQFSGPTLPHMLPDGRVQGHLAGWNVCHVGIRDKCVIAPHSQTDYAWFHTSPPVKTTEGPVKVGRLTVGGGHAGERLSPAATISHYDNVGTCFALVHVGEDEHGIWFSGVAAPGASAEQIAQGLAAPLSGDWRGVGGNLELVAALSVNTPGFPIIASGAMDDASAPVSLIASLAPCPDTTPQTATGTDGMSADMVRNVVQLVLAEQKAEVRRSAAVALMAEDRRREALALITED